MILLDLICKHIVRYINVARVWSLMGVIRRPCVLSIKGESRRSYKPAIQWRVSDIKCGSFWQYEYQNMIFVTTSQHITDTSPVWAIRENAIFSCVCYYNTVCTVETLYSTIYYSKYFIKLNFDKSAHYVVLWTHKRHPIPRPFGRAMECLLWVL